MVARPDQALALALLAGPHDIWFDHPGTHEVRPTGVDLVLALEQLCIKAVVADLRDKVGATSTEPERVEGVLIMDDGRQTDLRLRDVLNKIVHGTPSRFEVLQDAIWLTFTSASDPRADWTEARFSATDVLNRLKRASQMNRDEERQATQGARVILESIRDAGGIDR